MSEEVNSMKNGVLQFVASDFKPIPHIGKLRTPPNINGIPLHREGISLLARYFERIGLDSSQIGVCSKEEIWNIHKEWSPGKEYKDRQVQENAFNRAVMKYVALFQKELRKYENKPLDGSVIEPGVQITIPDDSHAFQANELIEHIHRAKSKSQLF
tara:strand:+ start:114 stop:581 length:468 start_codon:yes stop_codon:yes gene_type:complete